MKSLLKSISNRSNSTSNNTESTEPRSSIAPVLPSLPLGISLLSNPHSTSSIPIPNIRRSTEPAITNERWARSTLPSYAVSRIPANSDNRALPEYQDVITSDNDQRFLNTAVRDYFGVSPHSNGGIHRSNNSNEGSALEDTSEENGIITENDNENPFEDQDNDTAEDINTQDDDDDPLIPRRRILDSNGFRRNTFTASDNPHRRPDLNSNLSSSLGHTQTSLGEGFIDLPIPINEPPIYSPSLGIDELRLISTVHLSSDHPASAYFNAIAQSPPPPAGPLPYTGISSTNGVNSSNVSNVSTGNKKLKLNITRGGKRMNSNGTGPLYIKLGREDWVEGVLEVGKVDRAIGLEVSIMGMVNVSYYVRGQYTVLDTLPLARNKVQLFPPTSETSTSGHSEQLSNQLGVPSTPNDSRPSSTSNLIPPSTQNATAEPLLTKDGQPLIPPGTSFKFAVQMPNTHYKDVYAELPPSCDLQQVGMQANVEYVLRVKLVRKGLRFNETLTVPVIYESRAYIPPRRIRALTLDDPLNPGWRTIELNGGKPKSKSFLPLPTGTGGSGIEVNLLLPSPPILYIPNEGELPKFPFHLHFHSTLPHVLSTFSNPNQDEGSKFVIRLTRVTIFRIGLEKEIRRIEIPTTVEVWQDGGEHIILGSDGQSNGRRGSTSSNNVDNRRNSGAEGQNPTGGENGLSSSVPSSSGIGGSGNSGVDNGGPLRRFSSAGSTSDNSPRRKSFLGDRRGSFSLRRRGSTSSQNPPAAPSNSTGVTNGNTGNILSPTISNLPPIIDEDDHSSSPNTHPTSPVNSSPISPTSSLRPGIAPVDITSTEVHLKGLISIKSLISHTSNSDIIRKLLLQSFIVPEMTLTYVLEIGIEPKKGFVKENFGHVWGGGVVEVVLGRR